MRIGDTISRALVAKGLTQLDLAKRIKRSPSTVHNFVKGGGSPRMDTLERVAEALDTSVAELLAGRWRKPRRAAGAR